MPENPFQRSGGYPTRAPTGGGGGGGRPSLPPHMRTPYGQAMRQWSQRVNLARRAGIDPKTIMPVARMDFEKVARGGTPLSDMEAGLAVRAAQGQQTIKKPDRGGGLFDIPGNIVKDITEIGSGLNPTRLLPTLAQEATQFLGNPAKQVARPLKEFARTGDPGAALREALETPGVRLAPGVYAAGKATTLEGREELKRKPLTTVLDVLPIATGAGKVAATGKIGRGANVATQRAVQAGDVGATSARQAFGTGRPVKGTFRALAPQRAQEFVAGKGGALREKLGVSPAQQNVARQKDVISREATGEHRQYLDRAITELGTHPVTRQRFSDAEKADIYVKATRPDLHPPDTLQPWERTVIDNARGWETNLALRSKNFSGKEVSPVKVGDQTIHYAQRGAEGRITKGLEISAKREARLAAAEGRVAEVRRTVEPEVRGSLTSKLDKERAKITNYETRRPTARNQAALAKAQARAARIEASLDDISPMVEGTKGFQAAQRALDRARQRAWGTNQRLMRDFIQTAPAKFHPMLQADLEAKVVARGQQLAQEGAAVGGVLSDLGLGGKERALANVDAAIHHYQTTGDWSKLMPAKEYALLRREVGKTWLDLIGQGYNPVWVHNVSEASVKSVLSPGPLQIHHVTPSTLKSRTLDLTPAVSDLAISMSGAAVQMVWAQAGARYITDVLQPYAKTLDDIAPDINKLIDLEIAKGKLSPTSSRLNLFEKIKGERYVEYKPDELFALTRATTTPRSLSAAVRGESRWLPKPVARVAEQLLTPPKTNMFTKATSVFKISVIGMSPKHVIDTIFGDSLLLGMRSGVDELSSINAAVKMVKEGEMPAGLSRHLDLMTYDQLVRTASGGKMGSLFKSAGNPVTQSYKFQEFVSNVQRSMAYIGETRRGKRAGLSKVAAHDEALRHAQKTMVDLDGFAPIERTILRQVFPFYAFTRYILKYTLSYPIDHPVRASILSQITRMEQDDWDSGLPEIFQQLFFMGEPDADGNVTTIDVRSLNPFRDLGDMYTWNGFVRSMHPAATSTMEALGLDVLSGSPELYPDIAYDPTTGRLGTKRPDNPIWGVATSFVPQLETLDYFMGITQNMRELKASGNEEAAQRMLMRSMFLPFTPRQINVPEERAKTELQRYEGARLDSSNIVAGRKKRSRFNLVPYQGKLVPADELADFIGGIELPEGVTAPRAIIPPPRRR